MIKTCNSIFQKLPFAFLALSYNLVFIHRPQIHVFCNMLHKGVILLFLYFCSRKPLHLSQAFFNSLLGSFFRKMIFARKNFLWKTIFFCLTVLSKHVFLVLFWKLKYFFFLQFLWLLLRSRYCTQHFQK